MTEVLFLISFSPSCCS